MSSSIELKLEQHQILAYRNNVDMVAQQRRNPLRGYVTEFPVKGRAVSVADLVSKVEAIEITPRRRQNLDTVPEFHRRWLVFPNEIGSGQYIDDEDKLRMMTDPTGIFVQTHTAAVNRKLGDVILGVTRTDAGVLEITGGGILGGTIEGREPGAAPVALPSQYVTPAGSTGLTLDKLIASRERLQLDDFGMEDDGDTLFCAITPRQVTDLLNIAKQTGMNLNAFDLEQLRTGKPTMLMGLTWVVMNRLPKVGANRLCPIWSKKNIVLGVWKDLTGRAWQDTNARQTPYCEVAARMAATRIEDAGVQVIECEEA